MYLSHFVLRAKKKCAVCARKCNFLTASVRLHSWQLGCDEDTVPPPLRGVGVENGKSAAAFLVPGGDGVGDSFSFVFKQLNSQEVALLPSLYPQLAAHFARGGGSLLTPPGTIAVLSSGAIVPRVDPSADLLSAQPPGSSV